ncbi:MAG: protein-L-isoaspartate O-methyltransferase [Thiotrichales bacterium]|nr:protein-L-isoaspartate O-methyltransferase [Thiotrichales bacterium]
MNFDQARFFMVEQQIRPWDVLDPKILDLLMDTPRHLFVCEAQQALAYSDIELPIGEGEAMMAPKIEGKLLQALALTETDHVLEVGTGSGYMTALLASMAQEITTIELHRSLQDKAKSRLQAFDNITFHLGDASQDWDDGKTYDAIILTGAVAEVPQAFQQKLRVGGRLILVCGRSPAMSAQLITRVTETQFSCESLFETDLKYLTNSQPKKTFSF